MIRAIIYVRSHPGISHNPSLPFPSFPESIPSPATASLKTAPVSTHPSSYTPATPVHNILISPGTFARAASMFPFLPPQTRGKELSTPGGQMHQRTLRRHPEAGTRGRLRRGVSSGQGTGRVRWRGAGRGSEWHAEHRGDELRAARSRGGVRKPRGAIQRCTAARG